MKKISEKQLKNNLYILKKIMSNFNYKDIYNIVFLNLDSFYYYLQKNYNNEYNINKIFEEIEPYIPLALCVDTNILNILNKALTTCSLDLFCKTKKQFYENAKIKFLSLIKHCKDDDFYKIISLCERLRQTVC